MLPRGALVQCKSPCNCGIRSSCDSAENGPNIKSWLGETSLDGNKRGEINNQESILSLLELFSVLFAQFKISLNVCVKFVGQCVIHC
jgi:hypothetical protein